MRGGKNEEKGYVKEVRIMNVNERQEESVCMLKFVCFIINEVMNVNER